jgi:hypothetical protein
LQVSFPDRTILVPEQAENGGCRFQTFDSAAFPKQKWWAMAAIYLGQPASIVVVASEEDRGIAIGFCVLVEMTIDGRQNSGKIAGAGFSTVVKAAL